MTTRLPKGANSGDFQLMFLGDVNAAPTIADGDMLTFSEVQEKFVPNSGSTVADSQLKAWAESGAYELTAITYDGTSTSAVSTATAKWPDGSAGVFTATTINSTYGKVDAYTLTHVNSGKTVTQAAVTRDTNGNMTVKPALTVA